MTGEEAKSSQLERLIESKNPFIELADK